eukprot:CAMPEP_0170459384 /NCGR_PEP_ID=MMETSP0123-20130129/6100_1 /TAXON_ID=182087 /ORGANISM="Favella ehrenbergii, Strain Fehren 1" /LENGTH=94 /DNA_ID=CAMNT_0010723971 /DNA_START=367 /DNA_END=648 /DNA_ORIENTATION=-
MSHVKRVRKTDQGAMQILLCTKWEYHELLSAELKSKIQKMATSKNVYGKSRAQEEPAVEEEEVKEALVGTVKLPDKMIFVKDIYERHKDIAEGW